MHEGRLLINLGVLALFLALVMPALGLLDLLRSPHAAPKRSCYSNLRQLSAGMRMYCEDYDDRFPPARKWDTVILPYVKGPYLLACPEAARTGTGPSKHDYAFNSNLNERARKSVRSAGGTVMLFESDLHVIGANGWPGPSSHRRATPGATTSRLWTDT